MSAISSTTFALLLLGGAEMSAQQSSDTGSFSVDVNLVVLHATVVNKRGGFVSGLDKQDFQIKDGSKPQDIRFFSHEDVPVAVGLIVDNSGSMRPKRADVAAAALAFVRESNPRDQMFIVNFNEEPSFGLNSTVLFSADPTELEHALNGVPARGQTALYDAIWTGLEQVKKSSIDKKVLIVISDGGDNASRHHTLQQVLDAADRSDVIIYTVGLFDEYDDDRNPGVLTKLAQTTGGEVYLPKEIPKVVRISEQIAGDIRNQYTIGYHPSNETVRSGFHSIQVTAVGPHREKCIVRTRRGYMVSPERKIQ